MLAKFLFSLSLVTFSTTALANDRAEFVGSFEQIISSSHPACETVFAQPSYTTKHFLTGPTRRIIVTNFSGNEGGFFQGHNFASNFGYNNDFLYNKTISIDDLKYHIEIYGIIDAGFVLMEADVIVRDADNVEVCTTSAEYFGTR